MLFRSLCLALPLLLAACAVNSSTATGRIPKPDILALPDARRMAVYHFGDPQGTPVFFFHGWPSDAGTGVLLDAAARKHHLHVIAPDRPGIGRSDPKPNRTLADWPGDVRAIAAHYRLGKFAVLGISGGGPYALATARAMPGQVTSVTVVSGVPPLDDPRDVDTLPASYRRLMRGQSDHPESMRVQFRAARPLLSHVVPDAFLYLGTLNLPAPDRAALANPRTAAAVFGGMRRSWRSSSDGVYEDAVLYASPWSFSPSQIRTPVEFWHGALDRNFPPELARKLAAKIPGARIHIVPDEGHYSLPVKHAEAILAPLARKAR